MRYRLRDQLFKERNFLYVQWEILRCELLINSVLIDKFFPGPAFRDVELLDYYATISLHSTGEFVTFNFGAKPFRFDLEKHILQEKKTMTKEILGQSIDHYTMHQIVHSYLLFHGYAKTLEAFEKVTQIQRKDAVLMKAEPFNEEDPLKKVQCQEDGIYLNGFFSEKKGKLSPKSVL